MSLSLIIFAHFSTTWLRLRSAWRQISFTQSEVEGWYTVNL